MSRIANTLTGRWPFSLLQNPVVQKEMRGRMRGRRAFVLLTIYLSLMSALIALVYLFFVAATSNPSLGASSYQAGKTIFAVILFIQVFLVIFVGPAFTMAAISGEKERQTYELLRTTLLSARDLVLGKLISALIYVLLLIFVSLPLLSVAFLLGGISVLEVVVAQLLILVSAVAFAMLGLFCSTLGRSTLTSSVITVLMTLTLTFVMPMLVSMIIGFMGPFLFSGSGPSWQLAYVMIFTGVFLAATNLPATIIMSEIVLVQEDALFYFSSVVDGHTIYILSPWYIYIALYSMLAFLLYLATVYRIRRIGG